MALDPQQNICVLCGSFQLTEATGVYDQASNPGGYGGPNPAFGDTEPYTADFIPPNSTTSAYQLDLYSNPPVPDSEGHYVYPIPAEAMGYDSAEGVKSGVWYVDITLGTSTKRVAYLATGDIERRIRKCVCCSGKEKLSLWEDLLGAIRLHKDCLKYSEAQEMIDELYRKTADCCGC